MVLGEPSRLVEGGSMRSYAPFFDIGLFLFCEPAAGVVDFAALGEALRDLGYDGWATVEHDILLPPSDTEWLVSCVQVLAVKSGVSLQRTH